jgi:glycosyltransferase involved in cell wall biosynthesis
MKVFLAGEVADKQGGGWSFLSYLKKGLGAQVSSYEDADIFFISGASMVRSGAVDQAKRDGKKIVLRTDNALRPSRNKGYENGMGKLKYYAGLADLVIYQCEWARDYLKGFLGNPRSAIIYNGVDLDIFTPHRSTRNLTSPTYLYSSASKGETKRWEWAWWCYQQIQKDDPDAQLIVTGNLSTPVLENGLDFFQGERYRYFGMIRDPRLMADIYRAANYLFAVYENDCYSNTYLEALACGMELIEINMTGGTPELLDNWDKGREWNGVSRMAGDYLQALKEL